MRCQGGQNTKKLSTNMIQKKWVQRDNTTVENKTWLRCRSTTHVFIVVPAVGGWSVWRWNGGWVSGHSIVSSYMCRRQASCADHLPQYMSSGSGSIRVSGSLSGGCGGSLAADLTHESSIRFSLNGRVILVCWRLSCTVVLQRLFLGGLTFFLLSCNNYSFMLFWCCLAGCQKKVQKMWTS